MKNGFKNIGFAFKMSLPIMLGFFPLGIAYGILMKNAGYNFIWTGLTSGIAFTGALQFLMVNFMVESTPILSVIVTALFINSRHLFYGISFIDKFGSYGAFKIPLIYGLCDEDYSIQAKLNSMDLSDYNERNVRLFITFFIWFYWLVFSVLGSLIGGLITFNTTGLDFSLTALFVVIAIDTFKSSDFKVVAPIAFVVSVIFLLILGKNSFLLPSILISVLLFIVLKKPISNGMKGKEVEK